MTISQEFLAALDDLLQAGAAASGALRAKLQDSDPLASVVTSAASTISILSGSQRTDQSLPGLASSAASAVSQLVAVAQKIGDSQTVSDLSARLSRAKAAGIGGMSWLTIIGLAAGAAAIYYLWWNHKKKKALAAFEYPDPVEDDVRPRLKGMSKTLGRFRAGPRSMGRLGSGKKYEFEPEIRLEGHRGMGRYNKRKTR